MDRPDDLDRMSAKILTALEHANHDGEAYWNAVHAFGSLVAELVTLRGFKSASLAYLRGPIDGVIEEACVVAADDIERGYAFARDKGEALERAAVVAWLREEFDTDSVRMAADNIERGEHRREKER